MTAAWTACATRLRASGRRTAAAAIAVAVAGVLLGTAVTVGFSLRTGFDRAADRADLPDVIARFDPRAVDSTDRILKALPGVRSRAYRFEATGLRIAAAGHRTADGAAEVVQPGRRGYAVVAGRDVRSGREVLVERGLARDWQLNVGGFLRIERLGTFRIAGIAVDPQNVAFPLASQAHVWLPVAFFAGHASARLAHANVALLWLAGGADPDVTLQQARATSFGIGGLRFLTRAGVEVLLHQAAGIVVALLAAVSLIAALAAGVLLGAGAHAEVQRSLATLGIQRAIGFPAGALAAGWAAAAAAIALPAGAVGIAAGALLAHGPTGGLLASLNELAPGTALAGPLWIALLALVLVVTVASGLPARHAARRRPALLLRGAELAPARAGRRTGSLAGPALLGARVVLARRARAGATVVVLAMTVAVLVLLLALSSLLVGLRNDPGALGRRYQLSVSVPAREAGSIARLPGVLAAAPRYAVDAAGSFSLQQPIRLIAFPGDHTPFEAPPLAAGRRLRSPGEAEVGQGLADALGLRPGGTLAVQTVGGELRFRVAGVVRALEHDGRLAYVRSGPVLRVLPEAPQVVAIRLRAGASAARVRREVTELTGVTPNRPSAATPRNRAFLSTLAALLRVVAVAIGGVSLLALAQALAVTARERRQTIAVLRAGGAGAATIARLLGGAVAVLAIPGFVLALVLEREALGPAVADLAAGYADLSLAPRASHVALTGGAVLLIAVVAVWLTTRRLLREPVAEGLRSE